MIEDEIIHWWKDEKGEQHKTILRVESESPMMIKNYPKDGKIMVRIINTVGALGIKLSPEEALKLSVLITNISREMINKKRELWKKTQ